MIFQSDPRLPISDDIRQLKTRLYDLWRDLANQCNTGFYWDTSGTAAPSSGTWSQGDKCRNTAPVEAGSAGSKYVVTGWVCTVSGTPGTWLQMRTLTGN